MTDVRANRLKYDRSPKGRAAKQRYTRSQKGWINQQRYRLKKYGLSYEAYAEMIAGQQGACAICHRPGTRLHVDHNHNTGKIRGLLCGPCNRAIGLFQDSSAVAFAAAVYLETQNGGQHA